MRGLLRGGVLILWIILLCGSVSAATLFGTIYDSTLHQAKGVEVTINTTPTQKVIATNGRYSFNVPNGNYEVVAQQKEMGKIAYSAKEEIVIKKEGSYVRDIVLSPNFSEEEQIFEETDSIFVGSLDLEQERNESIAQVGILPVIVFIAVLIILGVILLRIKKLLKSINETMESVKDKTTEKEAEKKTEPKKEKEKKEKSKTIPKDLQEIVDFIKSQENRVTQKQIRKQFPKSEAKISLIITDLEKRGLVEKIKKGRGNVIILK